MTIQLERQNVSTQAFIQAIKGTKGPYCVRTLPDIPEKDYGKQNHRQNWTFRTEEELKRGIRGGLTSANSFRNGVFLVVNNGKHSDDSITEVTAHFIDFDHVPMDRQIELLEQFGIEPSIITVPNRGLHAYWLVQGGEVSRFREIQTRLNHYFGSDPTIKNESRLMRLPGFYHHKASPKMVEVMYWHPENVYTQDELIQRLDQLGVPQVIPDKKKSLETAKPKREHTAPIDVVDQQLLALVEKHLGEMTTTDGEQYRCLCPLHDDHKPSGTYFNGNTWFYCHACGANCSLTELAVLQGWSDVKEYLENHRKELRRQEQTGYEVELKQSLAEPYSMPKYVFTQTQVENIAVQRIIHDVVNTFVAEMEQRNSAVSERQQQATKLVVRLWEQANNQNQPIVWPGMPGSGKSTLRNLYVDIKCCTDPTFGCILVVERKEDAEEIARFLNRFDQTAWSYLGWDESWCLAGKTQYATGMCRHCKFKACRVIRNQDEQLRRPVVITTHQRFAELARNGKLGSTLGHWIDTDGIRHERRLLIIDEALPMLDHSTMTREDLHRLHTFVRQQLAEAPSLQDEWLNLYHAVMDFLGDVTSTRYVSSKDIDIQESNRLKKALSELQGETWETLRRFLNHGGIVHEARYDGFTVTVAQRIKYKWDELHPFILDGTAAKDLRYPAEYQALPEDIHTSASISLHVCADFGFGKWYMGRNTDKKVLEAQAEVVRSLTTKHQKVLAVVRKDYEPEYLRLLANEIEENKVSVAHFGNLKGRNEYQECDAVLFLGLLDKGDEYYLASAINRIPQPGKLCLETSEYSNVHRFIAPELEKIKLNELAMELYQDIYRTQVRQGKPVDVYVFSRDGILMQYFAGLMGLPAVDLSWKPVEVVRLTKAEKHVTALIEALTTFVKSGERSISKSALKEHIGLGGVSDKVWRRVMKNDYVQSFCQEHGIVEPAPNSRVLELTNATDEDSQIA